MLFVFLMFVAESKYYTPVMIYIQPTKTNTPTCHSSHIIHNTNPHVLHYRIHNTKFIFLKNFHNREDNSRENLLGADLTKTIKEMLLRLGGVFKWVKRKRK